jgi:hypothetical protein
MLAKEKSNEEAELQNSSSEEEKEDDDYKNSDLVKCRYYKNKVPQKDEIVAVVTRRIESLGAYVELLEYDNIEAFIMQS